MSIDHSSIRIILEFSDFQLSVIFIIILLYPYSFQILQVTETFQLISNENYIIEE